MAKTPSKPTDLVLEQLRVMRAETNARFDYVQRDFGARFDRIEAEIVAVNKEIRGLKLIEALEL